MVESQAVLPLIQPQIGEVTAPDRLGQFVSVPQPDPALQNFSRIAFVCLFFNNNRYGLLSMHALATHIKFGKSDRLLDIAQSTSMMYTNSGGIRQETL